MGARTKSKDKSHIKFVEGKPRQKTKTWMVADQDDTVLGIVAWFSIWRKYSFFPKQVTVYEWVCLREIADFCEERTKEHKAKKK